MIGVNCVLFLVAVTFLLTPARGDVEVTCAFMGSCILPCKFQAGADVVIHWIQVTAGNAQVHSYYHNQDQLLHQNQHFKSRTSLFKNEISTGNASLQLTRVEVRDSGRYKCYTSTITGNKESFIILNVNAPVRKVIIQQVGNTITCRSDKIYPRPELVQSINLPSDVFEEHNTEDQQTEQQLYNITNSLTLKGNVGDFTYTCTVSTQRSSKTATLSTKTEKSEQSDTKITCTALSAPWTDLVWTFNHSQIILNQTRPNNQYTVSEEWKSRVKDVFESGELTLKDLSSKDDGTYTCKLSNSDETHIKNIILTITASPGAIIAGVLIPVIVVIAVAGVVVLILYLRRKKQRQDRKQNGRRPEEEETGAESHMLNGVKDKTLTHEEEMKRKLSTGIEG